MSSDTPLTNAVVHQIKDMATNAARRAEEKGDSTHRQWSDSVRASFEALLIVARHAQDLERKLKAAEASKNIVIDAGYMLVAELIRFDDAKMREERPVKAWREAVAKANGIPYEETGLNTYEKK